jgi:transcriptional regulator with XRE-family HTH domain
MTKTDYNNIGKWLIPLLDEKSVSVEDFARAVGVSRASIYNYIVDRNRPSEQIMAKMCHILKRPLDEGLRQYTPKKIGRPGRLRVVYSSIKAVGRHT